MWTGAFINGWASGRNAVLGVGPENAVILMTDNTPEKTGRQDEEDWMNYANAGFGETDYSLWDDQPADSVETRTEEEPDFRPQLCPQTNWAPTWKKFHAPLHRQATSTWFELGRATRA